jgi:diaminopimelate epimerase
MQFTFQKYQGTGNDFLLIDDRENRFPIADQSWIEHICHRRFGVGADGLILLRLESDGLPRMVYFNSDGRESTFCGNGGRCFAAFLRFTGLADGGEVFFHAKDGLHEAEYLDDGRIRLKMRDVQEVLVRDNAWECFTGSPHFVRFLPEIGELDVKKEGAAIRYSETYKKEGINVNFVEREGEGIFVRTYERGVEDETYSCGTGVTAAALVANVALGISSPVPIRTPGGKLEVSFVQKGAGFEKVYLTGPAVRVFEGELSNVAAGF